MLLWRDQNKAYVAVGLTRDVGGWQTAAATAAVGTSMQTATQAMQKIGQATNPQKMAQDMMHFQRENEKMNVAGEMMDDMMEVRTPSLTMRGPVSTPCACSFLITENTPIFAACLRFY